MADPKVGWLADPPTKDREIDRMEQNTAGPTDEAFFTGIYTRHAAAVTAYALRRCSRDDAADAVAETFVVVWRRLADVPSEPATKPWLLGVAHRVIANQNRGRRRRSELGRKLATRLAVRFDEIPSIERLDDIDAVVVGLRQLSADDRELLILAAWDGLTPAEIATSIGVSSATVRKRLHRARKRLAKKTTDMHRERASDSGHLDEQRTMLSRRPGVLP